MTYFHLDERGGLLGKEDKEEKPKKTKENKKGAKGSTIRHHHHHHSQISDGMFIFNMIFQEFP